jgi:hypothetical protein
MEIKRQADQWPTLKPGDVTYPPNWKGDTLHGQDCDWCHERVATTPYVPGDGKIFFVCDGCAGTIKGWGPDGVDKRFPSSPSDRKQWTQEELVELFLERE